MISDKICDNSSEKNETLSKSRNTYKKEWVQKEEEEIIHRERVQAADEEKKVNDPLPQ